jgi:hypothetical protein
MATSGDNLATRDDVSTLGSELRPEMGELRAEMSDLRSDMGDLRSEFREFRAELRAEFAEFKIEIQGALAQQTRTYITWMFGMLTAYTAMAGSLIGIATIVTH